MSPSHCAPRRFFKSLTASLVVSFAAPSPAATSPQPPNIVVILADDYGYGSLGAPRLP